MLVVIRFDHRVGRAGDFTDRAARAVTALAGRPGFRHARLGRSTEPGAGWVLVLDWESVGAWRRALSSYQVKLEATELLSMGAAEPSAFEVLLAHDGTRLAWTDSDLAVDADTSGHGREQGR